MMGYRWTGGFAGNLRSRQDEAKAGSLLTREGQRIQHVQQARDRQHKAMLPDARVAAARKAVQVRWAKCREKYGVNLRPYGRVTLPGGDGMFWECEICLYKEIKGHLKRTRWDRWTLYAEHMREVHQLIVRRDGGPAISVVSDPPASDEL